MFDICIHFTNRITKNQPVMNLKRVFGALLTVLGIVALIYGAYIFASTSTGAQNIKMAAVWAVVGLIFFISGIGLVKRTKDEA